MNVNGLMIVVFIAIFWGGIIIGYIFGWAVDKNRQQTQLDDELEFEQNNPYKGRASFKTPLKNYRNYQSAEDYAGYNPSYDEYKSISGRYAPVMPKAE
ncbi:MAG: hypothetical protein LBM38_06510 [Clostridiales bacterium]|jgi:nitrogen fixation-related uncharacterized protein|nr:hypothetical protein [Clostridiales bacterium]